MNKILICLSLIICLSMPIIIGIFLILLTSNQDNNNNLNLNGVDDGLVTETNEEIKPIAVIDLMNKKDNGYKNEDNVIEPTNKIIRVKVLDAITHNAIASYSLQVYLESKKNKWSKISHLTISDSKGEFIQQVEDYGIYKILISSHKYISKQIPDILISPNNRVSDVIVKLETGRTVRGYVIDDISNSPVCNAFVGAGRYRYSDLYCSDTDMSKLILGYPESCIYAKSNEKGYFILSGINENSNKIAVAHRKYAQEVVDIDEEHEIEVRLSYGYCIFGTAVDDKNKPIKNLLISIKGDKSPMAQYTLTSEDGKYRTAPLHPGKVLLTASAKTNITKPDNFQKKVKYVQIVDRDVEVKIECTTETASWTGCLYDLQNNKIQNWYITTYPSEYDIYDVSKYQMSKTVQTDYDGSFKFDKLTLGSYNVVIINPDSGKFQDWNIMTFQTSGDVEQDIYLDQSNNGNYIICGCIIDKNTGLPIRNKRGVIVPISLSGQSTQETIKINSDGQFKVTKIEKGKYDLLISVQDYTSGKYIKEINIRDNEIINNFNIELNQGGHVLIEITGCQNKDDTIKLTVERENCQSHSYNLIRKSETGILWCEINLEAGKWKAILNSNNSGHLEFQFEIYPCETTFVFLDKNEFKL